MKASELRIGNSIMQNNELVFVTWWRLELMEKNKIEYNPIPLTEEWLLKFGYKKGKIYYTEKEHGIISFYFNDSDELKCEVYDWTYDNIKYVHQLQNLYFALTSEELEIKDDYYR
jgi:hypothetical protein